jgi:hypothetical protein
LLPSVTSRWCGVEADDGSEPGVGVDSAASVEVLLRWCGLEAALGAVGSSGGGGFCAKAQVADPATINANNVDDRVMSVSA